MAVRLLYGIQTSSLRERCLREVLTWTQHRPDKRAIVIVPEQAKLDFEQAYLNQTGETGLLMAEILSFRRLATRLFGEVGRLSQNQISTSGQAMLLHRLLQDNRAKLKAFANLADRPGFIRQIAAVLGDLRRCGIDGQTLAGLHDQLNDQNLIHKVGDLATLLESYDQTLLDLGLSDPEGDLDALAALLAQPQTQLNNRLEWLARTAVWVVGFGELRNFTPQEYAVIEQLQQRCEQLTLTVMADYVPADEIAVDLGPDIFLPGRRTAYQLVRRFCPSERYRVEPAWGQANAALAHRLGAPVGDAAGPTDPAVLDDPDVTPALAAFVQLVQTANPDEQTTWMAGEIRRLVLEEGYRYRDLVIAVCNPADDLPCLQATFAQFGIPLFLDQVRSLSGTALLRTILGLLEIALKGWTRLPVMRVLRAGLLTDDQHLVDKLENDFLARGLFRFDRLFDEDEKEFQDKSSQRSSETGREKDPTAIADAGQRLALARRTVFDPIREFAGQIRRAPDCQAKVTALRDYLQNNDIQARCSRQIDNLVQSQESESALALAKSWNALAEILTQLERLAGQTPMTLQAFRDLIAAGMDNADSGVLPSALDQVAVGSLSRCRKRGGRILFILGAQSANLPPAAPPEGLLKDHDRLELSELIGQNLPSNARDQVFADAAMIYSLLTMPKDRLVMLAAANDPSPYFHRLAEWSGVQPQLLPDQPGPEDVRLISPAAAMNRLLLFCRRPELHDPTQTIQFRALAQALIRQGWPLRTALAWLAEPDRLSVQVDPAAVTARFGQSLNMSISQLEKYAACPFRHLAAHGLSLRERDIFEPELADSGTLLHALAERSLALLREQLGDGADPEAAAKLIESWLDGELDVILQQTMKDLAGDSRLKAFFSPGVHASAGRRLERVARTSISALLRQLFSDSFRPAQFEWTFDQRAGNALGIELDADHQVQLNGVIDRVDHRQTEDGAEFRVIDYKSGNVLINYDTLFYGLALQLPAYLAAYSLSHPDQQAADACYFHFDQPIFTQATDRKPDRQEIEKKLDSHFELRSLGLESAQLDLLQRHVQTRIRQWASQIVAGEFSARPRQVTGGKLACTYCEYRAICGFDPQQDPCQRFTPLGRRGDKEVRLSKKDDLLDRLGNNPQIRLGNNPQVRLGDISRDIIGQEASDAADT